MMDIIKTKVERFVFTLLNLLIYFINPLAMKKNFLTVLFFLISLTVFGQEKNLTSTQLAVSGYDLVSYFNNDSPQKGNKEHAVVYDSATYYFSTEENKNIFKSVPEKYLPQYGGWCAYAMARSKNVEINPEAYLVDEGKLYLFYKTRWNNTQLKWLNNPTELKQKADANWQKKVEQE